MKGVLSDVGVRQSVPCCSEWKIHWEGKHTVRKTGFSFQVPRFRLHVLSLALGLLGLSRGSSLLYAQQPQAQQGPLVPIGAEGVVSVKETGAKGDGITDDTTPIQSVLDRFSQHIPGAQVRGTTIYFPPGVYLISSPLFLYGSPGTGIKLQGALGRTRGTGYGSTIRWKGSPGATMFIALGVNNSQFDNIEFDLNGSARVGIHLAATNTINTTLRTAVSHGTATVAPGTMANITVGTVLNVGRGTNMEPVYVTATTSSTFTAAFAKSHGTNDPVGGSAGSSGVKFSNLTVTDVPIASTTFDSDQLNSTAGIEIGNPTSYATNQVSEVSFENVYLQGLGTGQEGSAGIVILAGGNVKNFSARDVAFSSFKYGLDWLTAPSGSFTLSRPIFAGSTFADIRANGGTLFVDGAESESATGHLFLTGNPGANASHATLVDCSVQISAPASDYVISYAGNLTLIGNMFFNLRGGTNVPKIQINSGSFKQNSPIALTSIGNYYQNAAPGYAPIYDASNNKILPSYYANQPVQVASLGDYGGRGGTLVKLNNYLTTSALTSQTAGAVAASGVLRAGDTDTAVAFRDHADKADVPGLAKDTSDVVFVGGTAGIGLNSAVQIGDGTGGTIQAPAKGTGTGPKAPGTVVGWVQVKVGDSEYFIPLMK